jgi:hypothetical protein
MSSTDRIQTVRNAWINALRAEVLRVGRSIPELPRVVAVGQWIASYADADGGGAFPGRDTLATLTGQAPETVTRAVKVLIAAGVLERKRRPNASAVYQLLIPTARPDWAAHMALFTDTRQRRAYAAKKRREAATEQPRAASTDAVRTASVSGVPDSVHGHLPDGSDSVHGRPRTASMDTFRTASTAYAYQYTPTSGRDPETDQETAEPSPQPQTGDTAPPRTDDPSPTTAPPPGEPATEPSLDRPPARIASTPAACPRCHHPMIPRPGRTHCGACTRAA